MTAVNVQSPDFSTRYVDPEGVPIPNAGQTLLGGSSNAPKFGTLIPNRIFVGGIPSNTTEQELKTYFSGFGQVKDVKIINERLGISKGSYGFVTFESQEVAEAIIKNDSETLIFKDRKLNIGHAIRKQQLFPRPADVGPALFFAGSPIPCGFQGGMPTVFPLTGQDYSALTQPGSAYHQMLLQQAGGAIYLAPQTNPLAASAQYSALQSHLAAQQPGAAFAALQHQQYQQASLTGGGPLAVGGQTSPAAVMAAAVAAMAAASQWSSAANTTAASGHQSTSFISAAPPQLTHASASSQHAPTALNGVLDAQASQVAALAAAVAAQQQLAAAAAWRWQGSSASVNGSTPQGQQIPHDLQPQQLVILPASNATTTSDYSTDHSAHASGLMELGEPGIFHCDGLMSPLQALSLQQTPSVAPPFLHASSMFEAGIAATSSPAIANRPVVAQLPQSLISPKLLSVNNIPENSNPRGQEGSPTPNLSRIPTSQAILFDFYPSGIPLTHVKQTSVMPSENLVASQEVQGCTFSGACVKRNCGGAATSPKKLTIENDAATVSRHSLGISSRGSFVH